MAKWAQGIFKPKNPEKYAGTRNPRYRSSWELTFMQFCDNNPSILNWASESIKIPYRHPLTGKSTVYVPDFFILYEDKTGRKRAEIIEIKPSSQTFIEEAKSVNNKAALIVNYAKWEAAKKWAEKNKCYFRIVTEKDIFR